MAGRRSRRVNVLGILVLGGLAGVWELAARTNAGNVRFLPAPSEVVIAAEVAVTEGEFIGRTLHTVGVAMLGWLVASAIGISVGMVLGMSHSAYRYAMTSFEVSRAIPPITLVPAALLAFGFSMQMELVLVVFGGIWPVLINTTGGVRSVSPEQRDVASMLALSAWDRSRKIVLPAALPEVVVGLRLSLSLCLVLAVVAEMVGNPKGIGNGLMLARQSLQPDLMFVYVIAAGLLGMGLNSLFDWVVRRTVPAAADRYPS